MGYRIYSFLSYLLLPFAFLRLYRKGRLTPGYRKRWSERCGYPGFKLNNKEVIWVHAVSLGESIAAMPLIRRLLKDYPDQGILITNMTPTGSDYIKTQIKNLGELGGFGKRIRTCYLPYDVPVFIKKFLKEIKPKILLLIETELWPNLLKELKARNIPVVLVNARLSERSYEKYAKFKNMSQNMLSCLSLTLAQTQDEAERFIQLGQDPEKIQVTGSLKFDLSIPDNIEEKASPWRLQLKDRPVWIAASTHEGEESYLLDVHRHFLRDFPAGLLILAPRHPERLPMLQELCKSAGFSFQVRSESEAIAPSTQIFIVNTMGELLLFYALSDVAFVGGSLVPRGGHNLLEPAALKKATLTGPHVFNFQKITETLVQARASIMTPNSANLTQVLKDLFKNPAKRQKMGEAGFQVVAANRGALDRQYALIRKLI